MPPSTQTKLSEVPRFIARKFAHLAVVGDDEKSLHKAIDFLVKQVLLEKGSGTLKVIRQNFEEFFLLKFARDEVAESLTRLVADGYVIEKAGRYALDVKEEGTLKKLNSDTRSNERQIYTQWIKSILARYPELQQQDRERLVDDLKVYLYKLFLRNGAECAGLINPSRDTTVLKKSSDVILRELPPRSKDISLIRQIEFPRFLKDADTDRRIYFASLLDGTFIYQVIQIDPETLKVVRSNFKNYVLYLDTNILYSLLGLRDTRQTSTIEKSFALARSFGIHLVVSPRTVEEMQTSLQFQTAALLRSPNIRRNLAEIGADISEEETLTTAYWRTYAKTGIKKEEFIERFRHLPELLKSKQIPIIDEHFRLARKTLRAEMELLNKSIQVKKPDNIADHDAFHRLLIEELRQRAIKSNSPKRYWFLSWDAQLVAYANKVRKTGISGFVYLPHQLVQILRLYTQRTREYDETFLELFTRPQIKSAQNVLPNDFAEKVLTKISSFADLPEELAVKIMLDSRFVSSLRKKDDETLSKEIEKEVDTRLTEQLRDLANRVKELEQQKALEDQKVSANRAEIGNRDRTINHLKTALFVLALFCLILVNLFIYYFLIDYIPTIGRYALIGLDIALIVMCFGIRWTFDRSFYYGTGIASLIGLVFLIVPMLPITPSTKSQTILTTGTTTGSFSTSTVSEH